MVRRKALFIYGLCCLSGCFQTAPGDGSDTDCADEIRFEDPALEAAVRAAVDEEEYVDCLTQDVADVITELTAYGLDIVSLNGLEQLTELDTLRLSNNRIDDIAPLGTLLGLTYLDLANNPIENVDTLGDLTNLTVLNLCTVDAANFHPLARLTRLRRFSLCQTDISDIGFVRGMTDLESLFLGYNSIADLAPLADKKSLISLHVNHNDIIDIAPLVSLVRLEKLVLSDNPVFDIGPLVDLAERGAVNVIDISHTAIDCDDQVTRSRLQQIQDMGVALTHDCGE